MESINFLIINIWQNLPIPKELNIPQMLLKFILLPSLENPPDFKAFITAHE